MATKQTAKVQAEIDKARAKLSEQQARLKELEGKRTELENMEIVDIVRGMSIPLDDLAAVLQTVRGGGAPASDSTSGRIGPKSKTSIPDNDTTDKEGESE